MFPFFFPFFKYHSQPQHQSFQPHQMTPLQIPTQHLPRQQLALAQAQPGQMHLMHTNKQADQYQQSHGQGFIHQNIPLQGHYNYVSDRGMIRPTNIHNASVVDQPGGLTLRPLSVPHQAMSETSSLSPKFPFSEYSNPNPRGSINQGAISTSRMITSYSPIVQTVADSADEKNKSKENFSMPNLNKRGGNSRDQKQQYLACPKCNKEFSENSNNDLIKHIDICNA